MFYGRISDVYLGVITLTVTLILFNSVNSTAGPEFHIGSAKLGGFNGIPGIPSLNVPFFKDWPVDLEGMFYLSAASLLPTYFGLRVLLASRFGRTWSASARTKTCAAPRLRSSRLQARDLHHRRGACGLCRLPVRQLGLLRQPDYLPPGQSAQIIIWVIVGGRGTLIGPILGCVGIEWLTAALALMRRAGLRAGRRCSATFR